MEDNELSMFMPIVAAVIVIGIVVVTAVLTWAFIFAAG
jgi:hypothetical protein